MLSRIAQIILLTTVVAVPLQAQITWFETNDFHGDLEPLLDDFHALTRIKWHSTNWDVMIDDDAVANPAFVDAKELLGNGQSDPIVLPFSLVYDGDKLTFTVSRPAQTGSAAATVSVVYNPVEDPLPGLNGLALNLFIANRSSVGSESYLQLRNLVLTTGAIPYNLPDEDSPAIPGTVGDFAEQFLVVGAVGDDDDGVQPGWRPDFL